MFILLLTLLVVAVSLIIAGLVLSPRHQESVPSVPTRSIRQVRRSVAQYDYSGSRQPMGYGYSAYRDSGRPVGVNRQMRVRRSTVEVERQTFANVFASMNVGSLFKGRGRARAGEQTPWLGVALILIAVTCFSLVSLRMVLPGSVVLMGMTAPDESVATPAVKGPALPLFPSSGASAALLRVNQTDPAQYKDAQEFNTWWPSACSAASMTEVLNAYNTNHARYRITDILSVETGLHQITPDLGLLSNAGIGMTVAKFGFKATQLANPSVDEMITIAKSGNPVIINFPPSLWPGGHLLVLRGGDKNSVYLADSSKLNMQVMPRANFLKYWAGFGMVVTPNK
jgi:Peptidase_C39 like family